MALAVISVQWAQGAKPTFDDRDVNPHDRVVFMPTRTPQYNEHFHVVRNPKTGRLLAFWTQHSYEGSADMHIMFSRSEDEGRTWSKARLLWGSPRSDNGRPNAMWQLPMVSKSGRVYCVWNQNEKPGAGMGVGMMMGAVSEDDGQTWSESVRLMAARRWCAWQRPLRVGRGGKFLTAVSVMTDSLAKTCFLRFENVDEDPAVADLKFRIFGEDRTLEGEEASIVKLPDGRLFAVMRSRLGVPLWTQSTDGGETWTDSRTVVDVRGRAVLHPRSPCPMYDIAGDAAASGMYFALFTDAFDPNADQWEGRGPLYRYDGAYDPVGGQPVRFVKRGLLMPRDDSTHYGNSCYSSYTYDGKDGILWYPDNKRRLYGVIVSRETAPTQAVETIENSRMRLVVAEDATVRSLVLKATGEECLAPMDASALFSVTQDRPFNNEIKLIEPAQRTTWQADRLRREGDRLIVGFPHRQYEAVVRLLVKPEYVTFELEDFRCDRKSTYDYLQMDIPPVASFRVLQLPVKNRRNFGKWLNASWDEKAAVAVVATSQFPDVGHEGRTDCRILTADLVRGRRLRGGSAAVIVGSGREDFLDCMDRLERDYALPLGVESRRSEVVNEFIYHVSGRITPQNIDRHIHWARRGGFSCMTFNAFDFTKVDGLWGLNGDYDWNEDFPNGAEDLRRLLGKVKAAGIHPGLHFLHTHIGMKSRYVTPVADPRLNKTRRFTLAKPLTDATNETEIAVFEPTEDVTLFKPCRILQLGGELVSYESYTRTPPYRFLGVKRGAWNTRVVAHPRGEVGGILDISEYGTPLSCYVDQNTDLQDEVGAKIAAIYNCGFEYAYFDGSEGVNVPCGFHVPNAQYRLWKLFNPKPLFAEGAAKSHFNWHMLSGANAFDCFDADVFKEKLVQFPVAQAPAAWQDMTRVNFGWWQYFPSGRKDAEGKPKPHTRPEDWQFACSQCLAWDCSASILVDAGGADADYANAEACFEVMRLWGEARRKNLLSEEQKFQLRDASREFQLRIDGDRASLIEVTPR